MLDHSPEYRKRLLEDSRIVELRHNHRSRWESGTFDDPMRCTERKYHEVSSVIFPFRRPARKPFRPCQTCGDLFDPRQAWHRHCPQCYFGDRLYRAIARYRETYS